MSVEWTRLGTCLGYYTGKGSPFSRIIFQTCPQPSSFYTHLPAYEDGTECSETSAYKIQTPGNHPKESKQQHNIILSCHLFSRVNSTQHGARLWLECAVTVQLFYLILIIFKCSACKICKPVVGGFNFGVARDICWWDSACSSCCLLQTAIVQSEFDCNQSDNSCSNIRSAEVVMCSKMGFGGVWRVLE